MANSETTSLPELQRLVRQVTSDAVSELEVRVDRDQVLIEGSAPSYYVKQLATQAALAANLGTIHNNIRVERVPTRPR